MKIKIYTDNRANKQGLLPVRVSVSFMGRRLLTSIGVAMLPTEFEALRCDYSGTGFVHKDCHSKHKELIRLLRNIEDRLEWEAQKVVRGEIKAEEVSLTAVVNECKGKPTKTQKEVRRFKETWLEFVQKEARHKDYSDGTVGQLTSTMHVIEAYAPRLTIADMATSEWMRCFVDYNINRGLNNQSVRVLYVRAHWFLTWCFRQGYCDNDFDRYHLELKSVDGKEKLVVFLTMKEIQSIQKLELDGQLAITRDFFLFQCFTGLRMSDVARLRKTDIRDGCVHIVTQKTGVSLVNKLNKFAMSIVEKYADLPSDMLFPFININSLNRYLRVIGKMAGIDEPVRKVDYRNHKREEIVVPKWQLLTTHVGRKSFVVNSLDMGLTATQVIGYTGHSSITAMQPYISISQKKKDAAMDVWNNADSGADDLEELNRQMEAIKRRMESLKGAKGRNG